MGFYENHILPYIIHFACAPKPIRRQRWKVVPRARGRVLEIGMGSGHNLRFYDREKVEMVWGLEPAASMRRLARAQVQRAPFEVRFLDRPGEEIPLEDRSVDTVLTTYTLCTIPDGVKALEGMRRVLKPGGELLFLEHGVAPDEAVRRRQERANPAWRWLFGGCQLIHPIPDMIRRGGFEITTLEAAYVPGVPIKIAAFEYWGAARIRG
jgi:ubiquinone/menaquinone biosynthesis C-methylase UbiE